MGYQASRRMKSRPAVAVLCGLLGLLGWVWGASGEEPKAGPKAEPDNAIWHLTIDQVLPAKSGPSTAPLEVYLERRDGKWSPGFGEAPGWNKGVHMADSAGLNLADGKLSGALKVTVNPDPWMPMDHKAISLTLQLDGAVRDGALEGTWKGTVSDKPATGPVHGQLAALARPDLQNCRITLTLEDALHGGEAWRRRMALAFTIKDGQATGGRVAPVAPDKSYLAQDFDAAGLKLSAEGLAGEFTLTFPGGEGKGAAAGTYLFTLKGFLVGDRVSGSFISKLPKDDAKATSKEGFFLGRVEAGK